MVRSHEYINSEIKLVTSDEHLIIQESEKNDYNEVSQPLVACIRSIIRYLLGFSIYLCTTLD